MVTLKNKENTTFKKYIEMNKFNSKNTIMEKNKTNGCEVKSTNSTVKVETVNVKGKDILVFTTENGSKVQFLEDYLIPDGTDNGFTEIGRVFCVYNKDFSKRYLINLKDSDYWMEHQNPYPFIYNEETDTCISLDMENLWGQIDWIPGIPTFEEWSVIFEGEEEVHDQIEKCWYDSVLESEEDMDMNPELEGVFILKDTKIEK